MDKLIIEETELYNKLETEKEKKDYVDTYLTILSCFGYLDQYDFDLSGLQTINDLKNVDIEPMCKSFFTFCYFKSQIQKNKSATKGTEYGFKDIIDIYGGTLGIMGKIIMYKDDQQKTEEFFN